MTTPTETPIYKTRLHPIVFAAPIIWIVIAGIMLVQQASTGFAGFIALVALAFLLMRRRFEIAVFSDRVQIKNAFGTSDILRSQIEMVDCVRPIFAAASYGTVVLRGTGVDQVQLRNIPEPERLRDEILRRQPEATVEEKVCPECAEKVKAAALVCRFCGHKFAPGQ